MDRSNWSYYNTDHCYNQAYQQDYQQDSQYTFPPETGQTSGGGPESGAWGSYPAPGQPYLDLNPLAQIPSLPRPDWEYLQHPPQQPIAVEDTIQSDEYLVPPNPQPAAEQRRGKVRKGQPSAKVRFLAGLEAYARGALLKDCSDTLPFYDYIRSDGTLVKRGIPLYGRLTDEEKTQLNQAINARKRTKVIELVDDDSVKERFLAGLDNYAQGVPLPDCSATLKFETYVTDKGFMTKEGRMMRDGLSLEDQERVNQALLTRKHAAGPVAERFLAGLGNYARGDQLKDCSSILQFRNYVSDDGRLYIKGQKVFNSLSPEDQARVHQALLSRQRVAKAPVEERFLAGLDHYAEGAQLPDCSATIPFKYYASDDGHLTQRGQTLFDSLSAEDQERVNRALTSRRESYLQRMMDKVPIEERFLASLDNYAKGMPVSGCSRDIRLDNYVTGDGRLRPGPGGGESLYSRLGLNDKERVNRALLSRREIYSQRMKDVKDNASVEERFLASLDNYKGGVSLNRCSRDIRLENYVTDDGRLRTERGESLYSRLGPDDKVRVNQALAERARVFTQRISEDVDLFLAALEPYGNGQPLEECVNKSGLRNKVIRYFTPEGGLTYKGKLLIENLLPNQQTAVWSAIEKRRQFLDHSAQVPESSWQLPEIPSFMPEVEGMCDVAWQLTGQAAPQAWGIPAELADPPISYYGREAVGVDFQHQYDPVQTDAMWATVWQLTGQAAPGTWGIPVGSAEPPIPYYGSDIVGTDFQHRYDSNGLMPQSAPDRLIGRGIEDRMLINILGEEYRVHYTGSSGNPTNENPYGNRFMLVPRMRGG